MTFNQRRLILNSFITLYFSYCPIVWMFHSRKLNEGINYIHKRDLRIVSKDFKSSFQELFIEALWTFITEIYKNLWLESSKLKKCLSPKLMNDVFEFIEKTYSLRTTSRLRSRKIRASKYDIETSSYLGSKLRS